MSRKVTRGIPTPGEVTMAALNAAARRLGAPLRDDFAAGCYRVRAPEGRTWRGHGLEMVVWYGPAWVAMIDRAIARVVARRQLAELLRVVPLDPVDLSLGTSDQTLDSRDPSGRHGSGNGE